jgi:GNAT superfamily N-acetyltransferase
MTEPLRPPAEAPVSFREMTLADIADGLRLCRASRWNQVRRDWELFLTLSPRGCRVAVKDGRVIGTVTTVSYEGHFGWVGMVLVDPAERGRGVGTRLLHEAIDVLSDVAAVRLDATPAGRALYSQHGFVDEYGLSRMETVVTLRLDGERGAARPMTKADLPAVLQLDCEAFGADRRATLEWMLAGAGEYAWVVERGSRVAGYLFGRHGFNHSHLGPVVAEDQEAARQLVAACLGGQRGKPFILDAARHDSEWSRWLEAVGFREQRPFIRMYRGENRRPGLPAKQFAILGPEFG